MLSYETIITNHSYKHLVEDCYDDYLEELDADWSPIDIEVLSKSNWLKTNDAKSFIMQVYNRRNK
tara:strand:+ start:50 stop:244 length:195 start_codon:yes stop_codon:yes gene_type:complete